MAAAAAAAATETQMGLGERVRVPSKRKLEHRNRSNRKDVKTKRRGDFENHKKTKKLRGRRKPVERGLDDDEEEEKEGNPEEACSSEESGDGDGSEADMEVGEGQEEGNSSSGCEDDGSDGEMQKDVTKFSHGCRAFKMAFTKIVKKSAQTTLALGPILSAHKKLVVKKLAEEEEEQKAKGEAKKERNLAAERGHVMPASFLDSKEKFLLSVATKGVVKLFNAVNKAQNSQKGLNPSSSRDAKQLAKRKKEAFFSELRKPMTKPPSSTGNNNEEPGWAPLRDSYLLTSSKLKDWDKMENSSNSAGQDIVHSETSSDEE